MMLPLERIMFSGNIELLRNYNIKTREEILCAVIWVLGYAGNRNLEWLKIILEKGCKGKEGILYVQPEEYETSLLLYALEGISWRSKIYGRTELDLFMFLITYDFLHEQILRKLDSEQRKRWEPTCLEIMGLVLRRLRFGDSVASVLRELKSCDDMESVLRMLRSDDDVAVDTMWTRSPMHDDAGIGDVEEKEESDCVSSDDEETPLLKDTEHFGLRWRGHK